MCVDNQPASQQIPVTTNFGLGQCAGSGAAEVHSRCPPRAILPMSLAAADDHHTGFDMLFASAGYSACLDMHLLLQEFVRDLEARSEAIKPLKED
jgi:hypothetical protein